MSTSDSEDKTDLTRLEDLSEFLHEPDPETEAILAKNNKKDSAKKASDAASLDDLDELDPEEEKAEPDKKEEHDDITIDEAIEAIESDSTDEIGVAPAQEVEEPTEEIAIESVPEVPENATTDELSLDTSSDTSSDTSLDTQDTHLDAHEDEHDTAEFQIPTLDESKDTNLDEDLTIAEDTAIIPESAETPSENLADVQIDDVSVDDASNEVKPHHEVLAKENFQDVRDFAESMTFGQVGQGGNPPYSIILRNILYKEDAEEIKRVLKEHGLLNENTSKEIEQGLVNGSILLSQLSEYPAIFLAHAFRRFDLTLEMGLSAELHRSKSYKDENYRGLVSKHSLYQNVESNVDLVGGPVTLDQIILSTLSTLDNYKIHRYLDVASESVLVDELTFHTPHKHNQGKLPGNKKKTIDIFDLDFASPNLAEIYKDLAQKLRLQAKELKGNAVVGINYQITPITTTLTSARGGDDGLTNAYRITCTGNVVWLSHLQPPL
ncbi:MAG: hypothetical protein HYV97_07845 [Bdellovibrio sp.]|nr:hypothetical protein [Bdellovibrio sp.]